MTAPKPTARELQIAAGTYCFSGAYDDCARAIRSRIAKLRGDAP